MGLFKFIVGVMLGLLVGCQLVTPAPKVEVGFISPPAVSTELPEPTRTI